MKMIKKETFMYDENLDRLMIFNNVDSDEKVYGSVDILNLTLDITTKDRIANVEIRNVSDYLKSISGDSEILKVLERANVSVSQVRGGFIIHIGLFGLNKNEVVLFTIPTEKEMLITA